MNPASVSRARFSRFLFLFILLADFSPIVFSQVTSPDGTPLSLREVIDHALLNNRQLQIERITSDIARFTLRASYGIYDPLLSSRAHSESAADPGGFDPADPRAEGVFSADSEVISLGVLGYLPSGLTYNIGGNYAHSSGTRNFIDFDSYKVGTGIYMEQPLLRNFWIDQPRWVIQVNKKNLKISELGVQFVAMSIINLTQQGYYDLIYAWENLRVQQNLLETREQFLGGIRRQIELGTITTLEERLAQAQLATIQTEMVGASNAVALASNNLKTLMGVHGPDWRESFISPDMTMLLLPEALDLNWSWRTGLSQRPDYAQLAVNLERADLTLKYRKNQLFPTVNLFGSYGLKGSDSVQGFAQDNPQASSSLAFRQIEEQQAENSMVGVLFSIPLTSTAERNNYKVSKELKKQAEVLLKQKEELILREIADAIDLARFSFDRAMAAQEAAQYAASALEAEEQRLQGGTGSIFFVLQAQTDLTRARVAELMAKRDYNKALSQLYFTEGTLLERNKIEFNYR